MKKIVLIACAGLALASTGAMAAARAISCNGCSLTQMAAKATNALDRGTVYVFNATNATVRKYSVITEVVDTQPYTIWKHASPMPIETELEQTFGGFIKDLKDIGSGPIVLPPGFPIRSVAGAYLDPGYTSTSIEDYLRELSFYAQLELRMTTIVSLLLQGSIPLVDIKNLMKVVRVSVEFPDGSSQDYEIFFSMDAITGLAQLEVDPFGNGRMPDGSPMPTGALSFNGFTAHDNDGSLREWIMWAQHFGLVVSGSLKNGTTMVCEVDGSEVKCVVTKSK